MLYRAQPTLPRGTSTITIRGLHDRAHVWVDGRLIGVVDEAAAAAGLAVVGTGEPVALEILVENQGRINYGPLLGQGKGILGGVQVDRRLVQGWTSLPVADRPLVGVGGPHSSRRAVPTGHPIAAATTPPDSRPHGSTSPAPPTRSSRCRASRRGSCG